MNIVGEITQFKHFLSIDDVPSNVVKLCFTNLQLTVLPDLSRFTQLRVLFCSHNRLTSIDNLPDNIESIFCSNNQITCINNLPFWLGGLFCNNNKIRYIKELPPYLIRLFCSKNQLTSIPDLPFLFEMLVCHNNPLHSLPYLPYSIARICCENVPNIYSDRELYTINIINNFRSNYFTIKYGRKLLFHLIRQRMNRIKYELLESGAKLLGHPDHIMQLLEAGVELEEISDNL
jgi:Leucine-rich repeat (LRR) protein